MANKVWVAVVPNTKNFASDLRKFLTRVEKTLELVVDVRADTRRAEDEVRRSVERMASTTATIDVDADTSRAERRVKDVAQKRDATVNVDADTGLATAQIAAVSRRRKVELAVSVSKSSLATVGTALAALSGARVAQSALRGIGTSLSNLDRSAPAIAGLALTIGSLGSVALSSVSGIVTLGASLAPLAALAAPLPGLLLAGVAAAGVFAAAMVDAGTQLGSLKGGFSSLQDSISGAFWERAKQPILDLVNGVLPSLQSGLTKVAASLGSWSASVAGSFQAAFSPDVIGTITGKLASAINASKRGTDAFAASIATLGTFGAQYLPGIGKWFSDISIRFNGFIQTVTSNGQLAAWVSQAGVVLGQLGAVVSNTFGIIGNVADAAFAAGGSGLQTLAGGLAAINQLTAGPAFQGALTTVFKGAAAGAAGLAKALGPIGEMFANLAQPISSVLSGLGVAAGELIGGIADALNQPLVAAGLQAAIAGLMDGIEGILPALPAMGNAFGALLGVFGQLAGTVGPVLGAAFGTLAPLLTAVAAQVMPVVQMLGPILTSAISSLAPVVLQLVTAMAPLGAAILPVLGSVLGMVVPLVQSLVPVFSSVAAALVPLVSAVLPVLQAALAAVLPAVTALLPAFAQLVPPIVQVVGVLASALVPVITALAPLIMAAVQAVLPIVSQLAGVFTQLMPTLLQLIPPIVQIATTLTSILIPVIQAVMPIVSAVISAVVPIVQALATVVTGVVNVIAGLLTGNFSQAWQGAQQIVSGVWGAITSVISGAVSVVQSVIGAALNVVRTVFSTVFGALGGLVSGAMSAVGSAVSSGISNVVSFFTGLPGKILAAVSSFASLLVNVGRNLMQGFINGVAGFAGRMISAVTAPISGAINAAKGLLGIHSPSRVFRQIGDYVGQGLVQGLKGSTKGVHDASRKMANAVAAAFDSKDISEAQAAGAYRAIAAADDSLAKLADRRAKLGDRLASANKKLKDAQKVYDDFRTSAKNSVGAFDVTDSRTGNGAIAALQSRLADVRKFTSVLTKLRKAGLDATSYKQFIAAGTSSLPLAQDLLAGGKGDIKKVASLQGQLAKASGSFATTAADEMYGAGVQAAKGLVAGLQSQQSALEKQMGRLAKRIVSTIRTELGIHSPSRVMARDVGQWIPRGIAVGIDRSASSYTRSLDALTSYVPSTPNLATRVGSAAAPAQSAPTTVTQENHFSMLDQDPQLVARKFGRELGNAMAGLV